MARLSDEIQVDRDVMDASRQVETCARLDCIQQLAAHDGGTAVRRQLEQVHTGGRCGQPLRSCGIQHASCHLYAQVGLQVPAAHRLTGQASGQETEHWWLLDMICALCSHLDAVDS